MSFYIGPRKKEEKTLENKIKPPKINPAKKTKTSMMRFLNNKSSTHMCYASNCCKMKNKRIQQSNRALYSFLKWINCSTRLKAKNTNTYIHHFPMLSEVFTIYMYILSLLNSTVSEQLSRDSNVKWSDIYILFLILARLFLPGSIGKNIGDNEHESVVVPNTSIHCLL